MSNFHNKNISRQSLKILSNVSFQNSDLTPTRDVTLTTSFPISNEKTKDEDDLEVDLSNKENTSNAKLSYPATSAQKSNFEISNFGAYLSEEEEKKESVEIKSVRDQVGSLITSECKVPAPYSAIEATPISNSNFQLRQDKVSAELQGHGRFFGKNLM